jgi:hypothetical protein
MALQADRTPCAGDFAESYKSFACCADTLFASPNQFFRKTIRLRRMSINGRCVGGNIIATYVMEIWSLIVLLDAFVYEPGARILPFALIKSIL